MGNIAISDEQVESGCVQGTRVGKEVDCSIRGTSRCQILEAVACHVQGESFSACVIYPHPQTVNRTKARLFDDLLDLRNSDFLGVFELPIFHVKTYETLSLSHVNISSWVNVPFQGYRCEISLH